MNDKLRWQGFGSSPLARGLPSFRFVGAQTVGIIPARAGFTQVAGGEVEDAGDHPRSRGVYTTK